MRNILSFIGYTIAGLLALDVLGFIAWVMSGQIPVDGYYLGTITAHALRLVF